MHPTAAGTDSGFLFTTTDLGFDSMDMFPEMYMGPYDCYKME